MSSKAFLYPHVICSLKLFAFCELSLRIPVHQRDSTLMSEMLRLSPDIIYHKTSWKVNMDRDIHELFFCILKKLSLELLPITGRGNCA